MIFSAILVGNESLTRQCGEVLLARGHSLAVVVTRSADVRRWAEGRAIRVADYAEDLAGVTVDWLLSVANLTVVPAAMLARASKGAKISRGPRMSSSMATR